jgi:hypothetical protein
MALLLIVWIVCSFAGYKMSESKGREPWLGALLGFALGLIGLIIIAVLPSRKPPIAPTYGQMPSGPAFPTGQPQGAAVAGGRYVAPQPVAAARWSDQQQYAPPPQQQMPQPAQQYVPPQPPPGQSPS